jgi:hypothetical protein
MKLKIIKREYQIVETDLDLPIYLYFQDEFNQDELIKITEHGKITIKYDINKLTISVDSDYQIESYMISERALTHEDHFNRVYQEALEYLRKSAFE